MMLLCSTVSAQEPEEGPTYIARFDSATNLHLPFSSWKLNAWVILPNDYISSFRKNPK